MAFGRNIISEIVGFINDYKIVISPVHACQINISRHTAGSGKVGMVKHIIVKAILYQNIANIIPGINGPVIAEAFGCQNKDPIISKFIVFYHCKSSKGFPQPYTVRQNAAIVFFQLTDNTLGPILLKAVKFIPYDWIVKAGSCKSVIHNVVQIILENSIKGNGINKLGRLIFI